MNPTLRAFLRENGLKKGASEKEAWDLYDQFREDGVELPAIDPGKRSATTGTKAAQTTTTSSASDNGAAAAVNLNDPAVRSQLNTMVDQALNNDQSRRSDIENRLRVAGLMDEDEGRFAQGLINNREITVEAASRQIFDLLEKRNPPLGAGTHSGFEVGTEAREKRTAAITQGLSMRCGVRIAKPAPGARQFRGRTVVDVCRELLSFDGVNVNGMTNSQIAARAIAGGSTSDFALILGNLTNTTLLSAYEAWPSTWRPFVATTDAPNFKAMHALKLSGSPDLMDKDENGEYAIAQLKEGGESYKVITKGRRIALTREMIINDDLRAFTRIPKLFGAAAKRMETAAVYSLFGATMADGKALFHADHKNLAGTGGGITSDTLSAGRTSMRNQEGLNGEDVDVIAAFLLTPTTMETEAEIILRSTSLPEADLSAGVHNPWAGKLTNISDPALDALSETAWYLAAHPDQAPLIEVAFLEGEEQPYVEEQIDFNSDALITKVRHDFGAGLADHVGGYKNPGA